MPRQITVILFKILRFLEIFAIFQNDLRLRNSLLQIGQTDNTGFPACGVLCAFFGLLGLVLLLHWQIRFLSIRTIDYGLLRLLRTLWLVTLGLVPIISLFQWSLRFDLFVDYMLTILHLWLKLILKVQTVGPPTLCMEGSWCSCVVDWTSVVVPPAEYVLRCWDVVIHEKRFWPWFWSFEAFFCVMGKDFLDVFICKFVHTVVFFQMGVLTVHDILGTHLT